MCKTWFLFLIVCGFAVAQLQDRTRQEGASGPQVVESVVSLIRESCLFPKDRLLLRRLAYVASHDGQDPLTYRPGFVGGIWAISQQELQTTQNNAALQSLYTGILRHFGVDWSHVQWRDLRKPLFSGLAAALLVTQTLGKQVPMGLDQQAAWYQGFRFPGDALAAYNFSMKAGQLETVCDSNNLDLAFIVDSSSSLSPADFTDALEWAVKVLDPFTVASDSVRVAFMTFSTGFKMVFDFDDHSDKVTVQRAIQSAQYQPGSTDTDLALGFAATDLFTASHGARTASAKVALVVTDGRATHSASAVTKAKQLRDKGVLVFLIGIGDLVDERELNSLATEPTCTHVQQLKNYQDLDSLRAEIQQLSCKAPVVLREGPNYTLPCNKISNFRIDIHGNETITIRASNGHVIIYGSFLTPYPNAAFHEFETRADVSREANIYIKDESRPLYLSVISRGSDVSLCSAGNTYQITLQNKDAIHPDALVTCYEHRLVRQCTPLDFLLGMYRVTQPFSLGFPNPCRPNHPGYHPHPTASDRFVYCDKQGTAYLVFCPPNHWYNDYARRCLPGTPPTIPTTTTTTTTTTSTSQVWTTRAYTTAPMTGGSTGNNPCTVDALLHGLRFFPFPPDAHKYIACTEWPGYAVVKNCSEFHRWSQVDLACIYTDTVVDPTKHHFVTSPRPQQVNCKEGLHDGDLFYHPHPTDPHKFIQCDQFGDAFILECVGNRVWSQKALTCVSQGMP